MNSEEPDQFKVSGDGKEKLSLAKAELQTGMDSGKFTGDTLGWTEGMSQWLPLSDPHWSKVGLRLPPATPPVKQRHGCFLVTLIFGSIGNLFSFVTLFFMIGRLGWGIVLILLMVTIFNIICIIALFRWKKWGFWGYLSLVMIFFTFNFAIGVHPLLCIWGLTGIPILFGVLHIGKENKGWNQLE